MRATSAEVAFEYAEGLRTTVFPAAIAPTTGMSESWKG